MQRIDPWTIAGTGLLLMPLLTMWHEIGGHALACAAQGGHVATVGAFYVDCHGLELAGNIVVAVAGVTANALLALLAYALWKRVSGDGWRLALWLIWVSEAFVASGYFLFSGVTGFGDLGIGKGGALVGLELPWPVRIAEIAIGGVSYVLLVHAAIAALNAMIGRGPDTARARRTIAHGYYVSAGVAAVLVGVLNPLGLVITIMSAAASSFGGLAGFISIGYATGHDGEARPFVLGRSPALIATGVVVATAFALILGPSLQFAR